MSKEATLQIEIVEEDADTLVEAALDLSTTETEDTDEASLTQSQKDLECA